MELFVNGYSAIGATNKEEMAAATLKEIKSMGYTVAGQPIIRKKRYSEEMQVFVPVISKENGMPTYCVRTFRTSKVEELEKVPYIDLTETNTSRKRW